MELKKWELPKRIICIVYLIMYKRIIRIVYLIMYKRIICIVYLIMYKRIIRKSLYIFPYFHAFCANPHFQISYKRVKSPQSAD